MNETDDEFAFLGDYEPTPEPLLRDWIFRLQSGETGPAADGIARRLIQDFCQCVWTGGQPERATLEWLAEVVSEILDDGSPEARKAFSLLPNKEGRKTQIDEHLRIRIWISEAIKRGYAEPEAKELAAGTFCKGIEAIRKAWRNTKDWELTYEDSKIMEEVFKQINRPLPGPKI